MKKLLGLVVLVALGAGAIVARQSGHLERVQKRLMGRSPRLSAGDFPAGVAAPVDDVAALPSRPVRIGVVPGVGVSHVALAASGQPSGYQTGWAIDVALVSFESELLLRRALSEGGERGGVDLAGFGVGPMALAAANLRDAAPRTVLLLGRSRGGVALAGTAGVASAQALKGRPVAVEQGSSHHYFLQWVMSRAGLTVSDVPLVPLASATQAGAVLRERKAAAAVGFTADVSKVAKELGGEVIATTADAPHLLATVLVARGDFAARYPDAIRRVVRGTLETAASVGKDPAAAERVLGELAPWLGDPHEAIRQAPPSTSKDNLEFFGLAGEAPVTYRELYESASALGTRLSGAPPGPPAEDTCELSALKYVAQGRAP